MKQIETCASPGLQAGSLQNQGGVRGVGQNGVNFSGSHLGKIPQVNQRDSLALACLKIFGL